jgi:hypothetical protein
MGLWREPGNAGQSGIDRAVAKADKRAVAPDWFVLLPSRTVEDAGLLGLVLSETYCHAAIHIACPTLIP